MKTVFKTAVLCVLIASGVRAADDLVIADFEGETYAPWTVTGDAFGPGPAKGSLPGQMDVGGFKGRGLVNSFHRGDDSTGVLTSPEFVIQRKYIAFLIGGGKKESLAMELWVDGKAVRSASGPNVQSGGSEALSADSWDVGEWAGKKATLRIVDNAKGGWGHINVDHIVQTDTKPKGFLKNTERTIVASARYLHFPVKNGAPKRVVTLLVDGSTVVRNNIELADGEPDWWAPMDVGGWKGRTLTLRVDSLHEDSSGLKNIGQSETIRNSETDYREALRGQFHFSPRRGWNNDPNGCVFYNGEYHLFFQHNPYGWAWENMHWGHAVSKDLVHWEELGDVLLPDDMGPMFSGSAVVDWKNTSGFGKDGKPPLVLFYTAAGNPTVQCTAYSTDGRTFTKYSGNPVVKEISGGNRDPKVLWHEPTRQWVMVLYVELKGVHTIHFFTSPNLKDWTYTSRTDGFYECPDFFELPVDGDSSRRKWVLTAASSEYRVGTFDGRRFVSESPKIPGHRGKGFYAAQSFSDVPDGRRLFIGWWQTETKGMPFNQSMTVPLELGLTQTEDGPRLTFAPARELAALRTRTHRRELGTVKPGDRNPLEGVDSELVEVRVEVEPSETGELVLNLRDVMVEYDVKKQEIRVAGRTAPAPLREGRQRITVLCDRTGVEVFASGGLTYVPMPFNLKPENRRLFLEARGGAVKIPAVEVHELKTAWR